MAGRPAVPAPSPLAGQGGGPHCRAAMRPGPAPTGCAAQRQRQRACSRLTAGAAQGGRAGGGRAPPPAHIPHRALRVCALPERRRFLARLRAAVRARGAGAARRRRRRPPRARRRGLPQHRVQRRRAVRCARSRAPRAGAARRRLPSSTPRDRCMGAARERGAGLSSGVARRAAGGVLARSAWTWQGRRTAALRTALVEDACVSKLCTVCEAAGA